MSSVLPHAITYGREQRSKHDGSKHGSGNINVQQIIIVQMQNQHGNNSLNIPKYKWNLLWLTIWTAAARPCLMRRSTSNSQASQLS